MFFLQVTDGTFKDQNKKMILESYAGLEPGCPEYADKHITVYLVQVQNFDTRGSMKKIGHFE